VKAITFYHGVKWCFLFLAFGAAGGSCAHKQVPFSSAVLERAVATYMGTPYMPGGSSKKGMDCSGFVMAVYGHVGVNLPHGADEQYPLGSTVAPENLRYGDVVFFNTKPWSRMSTCVAPCIFFGVSVPMVYGVTHNGIYLGDGTFVHAREDRGVTVDRLDEAYWKDRYIGARRYLK
jgi:cell wall-associated NlpC family hydrolase